MTEEVQQDKWFIFDSYREMKVLHDGKLLIVRPFDKDVTVPLFCPLCKFPLKNADDSIAYRKTRTCDKCLLRWNSEPEQVDTQTENFKQYIKEREMLSKPYLHFR